MQSLQFLGQERLKPQKMDFNWVKGELKWKNLMQFYSFSRKNLRKEIERKKTEDKSFRSSQDIGG